MSKKSKSVSKPPQEFMPIIQGGADALTGAYGQNAGNIQNATDQITGLLPGMIDKYQQGDAGVNAARGYNVDVLSGNYLGSNPYLDDVIGQAMNESTNATQAALGLRGLTGGSDYANIISKNNANTALNYRYGDYNAERNRMGQAASQSPGLAAADYLSVTPMLATLGASTTPIQAASGYAGGLGGLLGGYQNQSSKPSTFDSALNTMGLLASGAGLFSDVRLKTDISRVGATNDGLPIYTYRYGGQGPFHMGVMAQDVREAQPGALGPEIAGYMTVNYAEVR